MRQHHTLRTLGGPTISILRIKRYLSMAHTRATRRAFGAFFSSATFTGILGHDRSRNYEDHGGHDPQDEMMHHDAIGSVRVCCPTQRASRNTGLRCDRGLNDDAEIHHGTQMFRYEGGEREGKNEKCDEECKK